MELILKSNNEQSIAKIIALAKRLNVVVEKKNVDIDGNAKEAIRNRILNFKATTPSSFGDAEAWQNEQREDLDLPFA
jgi:cytochrome c556